jgi:hypothetical protein
VKLQTIVTSSIFLAASALSMTSSSSIFGDGDKSAAPALLIGSFGLIVAGPVLAVVFKSRNNKQKPELGN